MNVLGYVVGGGIGAFAGYLYYRFVGCTSGRCLITAHPWSATLYGAMLGVLIAGPSMR